MTVNLIDSFTGEYRFLSNFWPAIVGYEGVNYPTVEHAYQAAKTTDKDRRVQIKMARTPALAKTLGKQSPLVRVDWQNVRLDVMTILVRRKFKNPKNHRLRQQLLATDGALLIEGNHWGDAYWGVCNGVGENHLGQILMRVRNELQF